jgi:NAD(P)-dependent dehydrogenase (short-subunit alcohol dehydrogenase family)
MMRPFVVPDLTGRTAVVTGASSGVGLWTAIGLAKAGAHLVMVCRNAERGEAARAAVTRIGGQVGVDLLLADFADLKAVDSLGDKINDSYPRLDILVNNAGLFSPSRKLTRNGFEATFAVNHLAPFLLTNKLLPSLERGSQAGPRRARIVTVASEAHRNASIDFGDLMAERRYRPLAAYGRSKLANILFTQELARRIPQKTVTANCLHPGTVATELVKDGAAGFVWGLMKPFLLSPETGAANSIFVAAAPEIEEVSGAYFVKQRAVTPSRIAVDPATAGRLWTESERLIAAALSSA